MAKSTPAYQFYPADFDGATRHWLPAEVGCYLRLLNHQWINGPLPIDRLWRIAGATKDEWPELWATIAPKFSKVKDGLINERLERVREDQQEYRQRKADAGRKGGLAKAEAWRQSSGAMAELEQSHGETLALQSSSSPSPLASPSEKTCAPKAERVTEFEEFWQAYPKKKGKRDALKAWKQTAKERPPNGAVVDAVKAQTASHEWKRDGGQFIPHPATWLRAGRWDDTVDEPPKGNGQWKPPDGASAPPKSEDSRKQRFLSIAESMLLATSDEPDGDLLAELATLPTPEAVFDRFHEATGLRIGDSY